MTREEAIKYLKEMKDECNDTIHKVRYVTQEEVFDMAIKALEQEPSGDLISRQAVLELVRSLTRWCVRSEDGKFNNVGLLYDDVMFSIDKLPSVNPQEPKEGHWIYIGNKDIKHSMKIVECDSCHKRNYGSSDYCPNCGARMVEPQESEG